MEKDITVRQLVDKLDNIGELRQLVERLECSVSELKRLQREQASERSKNRVIGFDEALTFTGYSRGHLYKLTSERAIPHYKRGNRLFFKTTDLEEWLTKGNSPSQEQIEAAAETYCATHRLKFK